MGAFLTYALDATDNLVHVDEVPTGNKCNCKCRYCNSPLYAKNKGQVREHHFAHANGHECEGAWESSLHLLAKEVLKESGRIMLPKSNSKDFPTGYTRIHNVEIEKFDERYGIKPDAEGIMDNGERILIEFYVSHKVDQKKRQIIVDNNLKCIEIDIKYQALNKVELKKFLTNTDKGRKWIQATPQSPKSKSSSNSSKRDPMYEKTRDIIKDIFDNGTIIIHPHGPYKSFDLRQLGYDVCEINKRFRGFKSDLLLYRSQKKDGYISINLRGRSRYEDFEFPPELRIIDIVFKALSSTEDGARKRMKYGDLTDDGGMTIEYYGFK
jgi:hypothetical protein